MAGPELAVDGANLDVDLLYDINGLTKSTPEWLDRAIGFVGEYGLLVALVVLVLWCWTSVRRRPDPEVSVAGLVWAPLAAGIAVLVNIPIRGFVERPRPFVDHQGLELLVHGKSDFSFVSDHATLAMALGVGLFVANRTFGLIGIGLALVEGFCRIFMGVHYPTDVVGGFALGTATTLLLAPLAMALLTPLVTSIGRSRRAGLLVRARRAAAPHSAVELPEPRVADDVAGSGRSDLAA
ncbi:phosphatase PAP2 family protein [Streptomyces sp. TRM66268-LWL]|uniref:Phosphatase PAP2 family protein n=1 Tax=Streptomyces polyasparticus TaxID=2767826 RepID=A0ABR7SWJ3_9ACTN|nr:phosphatase PAP2 family protein [Streptomyces polyasparticus]MBC9719154.1 phosphatase PAP2 family protein [Streptomyces polyasparticus]